MIGWIKNLSDEHLDIYLKQCTEEYKDAKWDLRQAQFHLSHCEWLLDMRRSEILDFLEESLSRKDIPFTEVEFDKKYLPDFVNTCYDMPRRIGNFTIMYTGSK